MTKHEARKAKFAANGKAITALDREWAWRDRREDHVYEMKPTPSRTEDKSRIVGGPEFCTVQFERGVRRGARD